MLNPSNGKDSNKKVSYYLNLETGQATCNVMVEGYLNGRPTDWWMEIDWKDYKFLLSAGLPEHWELSTSSNLVVAVDTASGTSIEIARVLLDAWDDEEVEYLDGNTLNLMRDNLELMPAS